MTTKLGEELSRLRQVRNRNLSLREVQRQTGISNEYLSQLERGIATKPAPDVLQKLAQLYQVPYESLLIATGYLKDRPKDDDGRAIPRDIEAVARSARFTGAEWKEVREFMTFVASKRQRKSE